MTSQSTPTDKMAHHRKMDDSSPDLSLKLRRNSSDSRDSFYLDLDQGIDSDIEEMTQSSAMPTLGSLGPLAPLGTSLGPLTLLPLVQDPDEEDEDDTTATHHTDEAPW